MKTEQLFWILEIVKSTYVDVLNIDIIKRKEQQKNPRQFWNTNSSNLTADDFVKHFSSNPTNDNNYFNKDNDDIDTDINILVEELDKPFDIAEIVSTIQYLVRNKSCGIDNIIPDFFIDSCDCIVPFLVPLVDRFFETCDYPDEWTKGIIIPIFK